jgi:hypothetical protein
MTLVDYADYRSFRGGGGETGGGWQDGGWQDGGRWEEPEGQSRTGGSEEEPGRARLRGRRTMGVGGGRPVLG